VQRRIEETLEVGQFLDRAVEPIVMVESKKVKLFP
jgi:hypothetical protein